MKSIMQPHCLLTVCGRYQLILLVVNILNKVFLAWKLIMIVALSCFSSPYLSTSGAFQIFNLNKFDGFVCFTVRVWRVWRTCNKAFLRRVNLLCRKWVRLVLLELLMRNFFKSLNFTDFGHKKDVKAGNNFLIFLLQI